MIVHERYQIRAEPCPCVVVETEHDLEAVPLDDAPADVSTAAALRDHVVGRVRGFPPRIELHGWIVRADTPPPSDGDDFPVPWSAVVWRPTLAEALAFADDLEAAMAVAGVERYRDRRRDQVSEIEAWAKANSCDADEAPADGLPLELAGLEDDGALPHDADELRHGIGFYEYSAHWRDLIVARYVAGEPFKFEEPRGPVAEIHEIAKALPARSVLALSQAWEAAPLYAYAAMSESERVRLGLQGSVPVPDVYRVLAYFEIARAAKIPRKAAIVWLLHVEELDAANWVTVRETAWRLPESTFAIVVGLAVHVYASRATRGGSVIAKLTSTSPRTRVTAIEALNNRCHAVIAGPRE